MQWILINLSKLQPLLKSSVECYYSAVFNIIALTPVMNYFYSTYPNLV